MILNHAEHGAAEGRLSCFCLLGLPGPDLINFCPTFSLNDTHLVGSLQSQPELLRGSEEFSQANRCIGGDSPLLQDDVVHAGSRNAKLLRQAINAYVHGLEKFMPQNL